MRSNKMAFIVCFLVVIVAFASQAARAEDQAAGANGAVSGARLPESYGFAPKGPPDPGFTPEDETTPMGHSVCTPLSPCTVGEQVRTEYVQFGVRFELNDHVGVFIGSPTIETLGGVNSSGVIDLLTPVRGNIVTPAGAPSTGVETFAISGAFVAAPGNILLEVFDVDNPGPGATPLASSIGDDGFDVDGYHVAAIDLTGGTSLIKSFRVSTPNSDSFGVRRIYLTPPETIEPSDNPAPCNVILDQGVVNLPPTDCGYQETIDAIHAILDDPVLGSAEIEMTAYHLDFLCRKDPTSPYCGTNPESSVNNLEGPIGDTELFDSKLVLRFKGSGPPPIDSLDRTVTLDAPVVTETDPRDPGAPFQDFETEMRSIQASLPAGDPDFAMLQVVAGADNGLPPSLGHTTLTQVSDEVFGVVSFFDVNFEITFEGAPGGALDGIPETTIQAMVTVAVPEAENPIFSDGFESGDTSLWPATTP